MEFKLGFRIKKKSVDEACKVSMTNTEGTHNKFYNMELITDEDTDGFIYKIFITYGKIGTEGSGKAVHKFRDLSMANRWWKNKISGQLKKGYVIQEPK